MGIKDDMHLIFANVILCNTCFMNKSYICIGKNMYRPRFGGFNVTTHPQGFNIAACSRRLYVAAQQSWAWQYDLQVPSLQHNSFGSMPWLRSLLARSMDHLAQTLVQPYGTLASPSRGLTMQSGSTSQPITRMSLPYNMPHSIGQAIMRVEFHHDMGHFTDWVIPRIGPLASQLM